MDVHNRLDQSQVGTSGSFVNHARLLRSSTKSTNVLRLSNFTVDTTVTCDYPTQLQCAPHGKICYINCFSSF